MPTRNSPLYSKPSLRRTGLNAPLALSWACSAMLAVVAFIWMHMHMFPPENLGELLHSLLRVDLFFLVVLFAITMYIRQVINKNTRTILRALANTRQR